MGLDVAFDRQRALDCGMVTITERRGSDEDLRWALKDGDQERFEFYSEQARYIRVPGTELCVEDDGLGENIVVRANKWGRVYYPLTDWLRAHEIQWSEW